MASSAGSTIVAISGTNTSEAESGGIDIDFPLVDVDTALFPGSDGVHVHQGFYEAFQRMQGDVYMAVNQSAGSSILVVGHSLGERDTTLRDKC